MACSIKLNVHFYTTPELHRYCAGTALFDTTRQAYSTALSDYTAARKTPVANCTVQFHFHTTSWAGPFFTFAVTNPATRFQLPTRAAGWT